MRPHEEHEKYEPLEQAAEQAAQLLTNLLDELELFSFHDQALNVRDALLAGLVRTGFAEREARTQVLRERLARAHHRSVQE